MTVDVESREGSVVEVREVLQARLEGEGLRKVAEWEGPTARPPAGTSRRHRQRDLPAGLGQGGR